MEQLKMSSNTAKLHQVFGKKLYASKYSWISEICQNAVDSHRMAGVKVPVKIGIRYSSVNRNKQMFFVEDTGLSFTDKADFIKKVCTILESGKSSEKTNDESCAMGMHGIGSISVSAYQNKWTYDVITPTGERFLATLQEIDGKGLTYDIKDLPKTTDSKKVVFEVEVNHNYGVRNLITEMKAKLAYFKDIMFDFPADMIRDYRELLTLNSDFKIFQGPTFQVSTFSADGYMHISLDQYSYPIKWGVLSRNADSIRLNIGLRFGMGDGLEADLTRENLQLTDNYKDIILNKIKETATWFVERYNKSFPEEVTSVSKMNELIRSRPSVEINGQRYEIAELAKYSTVPIREPKFKDVSRKVFDTFCNYANSFVRARFSITSNGTKKSCNSVGFGWRGKNIFVDKPIPQRTMDYIKEKYRQSSLIYFYDIPAFKTRNTQISYQEIYSLSKKDLKAVYKATGVNPWRQIIKESKILEEIYMKENTILASSIKVPDDFNKAPAKPRVTKEKVNLENLSGEITVKYAQAAYGGYNTTSKFVHGIYKLKDFVVNKQLHVYGTEEEKDKLNMVFRMYSYRDTMKQAQPQYVACIIGKSQHHIIEKLKLENCMHVDDFLKGKHELFRQIVTAYVIERDLRVPFRETFNNSVLIRKYISVDTANKIDFLNAYVSKHSTLFTHSLSENEVKPLLDLANDLKLYDDETLEKFKALKSLLPEYDYVNLLSRNIYHNNNTVIKYGTVRMMRDITLQRGLHIDEENKCLSTLKTKASKDAH